jgi:hypothetical protein
MGIKTGQNIITEGLIVHVDFGNFKSNGGKPADNFASTPETDPINATGSVSLVNQGVIEGGWVKYGLSGQWTGGTYPYMFSIRNPATPFNGGQSYTASCEIYHDIPQGMVTGDFSINYVNDVNMPSGGYLNRDQSDARKPMKVYRRDFIYSGTGTWSQPGYLVFRGLGTPTFDPDKHHLYIRNVQIQSGSYMSPPVNKHRTLNNGLNPSRSRSNGNNDALVNIAPDAQYPVQFDSALQWLNSSTSPTNGDVDFHNIQRYPRFDSDTNSFVYFNGLSPSIMTSDKSWAYEVWYKPDVYPQPLATANQYGNTQKAGFIIGTSSYNGHGIAWSGNSNGDAMQIIPFQRTSDGFTSGDSFFVGQEQLDKWHHLVLVHNSATTSPPKLYFYVNGKLFSYWTGTETSSSYTGTSGLALPRVTGGGTANYRSMEGYIGEARVYDNKLLTENDVKRNYMATRDKYEYWRG